MLLWRRCLLELNYICSTHYAPINVMPGGGGGAGEGGGGGLFLENGRDNIKLNVVLSL